ncbi:MAG: alpha/beta hydrolase [Akkermansiaceae bacterium]|nr:alpha/beta hydrolase [Armatimonadota bacterium]
MQAVIEKFISFNVPPLITLTPQQARQQPTVADAVRGVLQDRGISTAPAPVGSVVDRTVPGPAGLLPVRVYTPQGAGPFPVLVYFHGGGWVIATIDTYDSSCRALCNAAQCVVVSVEYRKGPENPFPAAHEDAYAATQYVMNNVGEFNGIAGKVAVGGESAGGNLATAVSILARDRGGRVAVHQLSVYPVANSDLNTPSMIENADAVPLSRSGIQFFVQNYLPNVGDRNSPLIALVNANLQNLPPVTIVAAGIDPLRSDGQALADRFRAANVSVRYQVYSGVTHEFFGTGAVVARARDAVSFAADGLLASFA